MAHESVLVDTGALAALFDPRDQFHDESTFVASELPVGKAYTCWPVITEAAYLLRRYPRQRASLLQSINAGEFQLLSLHRDDISGLQAIFDAYHDQDVDLADAAIVYLADRERILTVFSLDRRHFHVFRTKNGESFRLLPDV